MKHKFAQFQYEPGVTIVEFKMKFDLQHMLLFGAAVTEVATFFRDKLDQHHYFGMLPHLTNWLLEDHFGRIRLVDSKYHDCTGLRHIVYYLFC